MGLGLEGEEDEGEIERNNGDSATKDDKNDKNDNGDIGGNGISERLKVMYVKLWLSLRAVVRVAFQSHTDVLEAGAYIQVTLDLLMKGKAPKGEEGILDLGLGIKGDPYMSKIMLGASERLQVA